MRILLKTDFFVADPGRIYPTVNEHKGIEKRNASQQKNINHSIAHHTDDGHHSKIRDRKW